MADFNTKMIHGETPTKKVGSKATPIYQTSAFAFEDLNDMEGFFGDTHDHLYTRYGNPNTDELGERTAALEEAEQGVATSSGMSAILAGVLAVAKSGDHVLAPEDVYGGTYGLFANDLKEWGIDVSFVSFTDQEALEQAIRPETVLLYAESVTNPLLRVEDISGLAELKEKHGLALMIDNTFATPYFLQPIKQGADLVVHSATKYLGGHSDVTAGVLVGSERYMSRAVPKVISLGMNLSPFEAWLTVRGLKTLSVRMKEQGQNAAQVARFFKEKGMAAVYYPESLSEKGDGAVVSVDLGDAYEVETFFASLEWVKLVATLAGVETTVSYPLNTSHRTVPEDIRERLGITPGVVRISVGLEDAEDINGVFERALEASRK
ncbi:trans-sulfuration enzyme family protein [Salsuginibacillus kocurii]|uniref:trans-sulfuration enzyme family protein n=1 Tax=Salsuginibacillus kocurii TaxID=427078 RepID=UPI00037888BA|nr:aminotransferase class I/II-fold pyridoxal phosphate-dependent enzyme [Salsuginibacillus kocurii]